MVEKTERTPQPGEYWDIGKDRVLIIGSNGPLTVFQTRDGRYNDESTEYAVETWGLLPDCTGWDWQPKPPQEYFDLTAMDGHVLRTGIDNCRLSGTGWAFISMLGGITVGAAKKSGWVEFRCRIEHAPKAATPPVESPNDWVDITDPEHILRKDIDHLEFPHKPGVKEPCVGLTGERRANLASGVYCRRRDLPPIEPKPSPQMQTFHEVIRDVHDDSDRWGNWQLVCVTHPKPTDIRTGRTETREVSR